MANSNNFAEFGAKCGESNMYQQIAEHYVYVVLQGIFLFVKGIATYAMYSR